MRRSSDRILTSHGGSLPRSDELIAANAEREAGKADEASFQKKLTQSVADVVRRQVAAAAGHRALRAVGVRFNDLGTFARENRYHDAARPATLSVA